MAFARSPLRTISTSVKVHSSNVLMMSNPRAHVYSRRCQRATTTHTQLSAQPPSSRISRPIALALTLTVVTGLTGLIWLQIHRRNHDEARHWSPSGMTDARLSPSLAAPLYRSSPMAVAAAAVEIDDEALKQKMQRLLAEAYGERLTLEDLEKAVEAYERLSSREA